MRSASLALLLPLALAPAAARAGADAAAPPIVLIASADDWVSVADAAGHIVLARLLHAGARVTLPSGPGFTLTAGNAGATTLMVDGKAAPPLGAPAEVAANQPLDPALIEAGRLPAQIAARKAARRAALIPAAFSAGGASAMEPPPQAAAAPEPAQLAPAPAPADPAPLGSTIALAAGSGEVIALPSPAASVFTADPRVADVRPASLTSLFVLGVAPGETTIAALDQQGHPIAQYRVMVSPSAYGADAARAAIARLVPDAAVSLHAEPNGLAVSGTVPTPAEAAQVMALARAYAGPKETVDDEMSVLSEVQVMLQVRIAEMDRTITRELGINWQALGTTGGKIAAEFASPNALAFLTTAESEFGFAYKSGNTNVDAILSALSQDQLSRTLAEPNLTAMSGQTASFLVGGEFPIPISEQNGSISVQFQPYGVSLSFIPTVLANNRISLRVRPEVSELTNQGAIELGENNSSIQIPALLVRRTETTIELGSGQSFAIAGLLTDQSSQVDQGLPGLGELPILGTLFNSDSFQRDQTELVIVVTPYIVRPVSSPAELRLPTDGWTAPSDLDRILFLRQEARGGGTAPPAPIPGDAGFIVQ